MEINPLLEQIEDLQGRFEALRGYLDEAGKRERLEEVLRELENPDVWSDPERAQGLSRERSQLQSVLSTLEEIGGVLDDAGEMVAMAREEGDEETLEAVQADVQRVATHIETLEFRRMFSGEMDASNAFLDIQAGSGGTEAQDWAEMLLRMYLRWAEARGFDTEVIEVTAGQEAGVKSATIKVSGEYAFGWLRTETGVHRLVRKSPFDSGGRRHTSFSSVFVSPEIDDENVDIEIDPSDLRVDVFRASGAGGQHVNTTESAVRITHEPTGVVVQSQNDRSQHKNRATAMSQLRAKLYELEMQRRRAEAEAQEETKSDIGWGNQIRSYVLDQSRIKDLRTGIEIGNTQAVLDGHLDPFIQASLKAGL
ncbi:MULTISPECIES: peptide chain release factor 2 [unclassified Halorhodospira]|uniref:peptide chain release factor 2 n=1 Tax=unclassified Halorhodospira TaxID=2626748 RepID=UPI001EE89ABB|nr:MULTISPECIES: peptide chain release factor 2 [unclassified Halorhodospira]MCG5539768.1 peptide chain release factor 2 [Halorhodospira sp. M39old]MCG5544782.1 peptide chain release factor 2 [Halorhodospira sp. M38]